MRYRNAVFLWLLTISTFLCAIPLAAQQAGGEYDSFHPGEIWKSDRGAHINAHGGGILYHEGRYYWFGEHKVAGRQGNRAWVGVHAYSSADLYNWRDEGIALEVVKTSEHHDITAGSIIERPKVIYNEKNDEFVMWFHLELKGEGYSSARTGVAVSDRVTGPYRFLKSYRPNAGRWPINVTPALKRETYDPDTLESWTPAWRKAVEEGIYLRRDFEGGQMSRDMTLYVDDDGTAYHIHSSEENSTLHISELTEDYRSFTGRYNRVLPARWNEAPALFKHDDTYYLIASGTTGWDPNPARLSVADSLMGRWRTVGNPAQGDPEQEAITFDSQSTYVLKVQGLEDAFIYMGDRWEPRNPIAGRYVWLPVMFGDDGLPYFSWYAEWDLSVFKE